jgi:hypothetical protein
VIVLLAGAALVALAAGRAPLADWTSGLATLVLMGLAAFYAVRRRTLRVSLLLLRPVAGRDRTDPIRKLAVELDRLRTWRMAHLLLGVSWALALWWHVDASHGSWLETALLVLCIGLLLSGVFGVVVQYWLPRSMLGIIEREVRVQDVDARRSAVFVQAEEKILGCSDQLVDAYVAEIRPQLQGEPTRLRLFEHTLRRSDPGSVLRGQLWRHLEGMEAADAATFRELIDLAEQKGRLDLNLFHLELSVGWLLVHDALAIGTAVLVALHLLAVAYF